MTSIILAAPDVLCEPDLVAAAGSAGLTVIRRCVDAADLLACAAAEPDTPVLLSSGVPRLSGDLVARLGDRARLLVALVVLDEDEVRARAWGVDRVVRVGEPRLTMEQVAALLAPTAGQLPSSGAPGQVGPASDTHGVWPTGLWNPAQGAMTPADFGVACVVPGVHDPGASSAATPVARLDGEPTGKGGAIVPVWGPAGSPGRTTTAIGLAQACAALGRRTLLVDADTYAPSISLLLGMVEDASGLVVACRHADNATLSPRSLRASARTLSPSLAVLGGLPRADRWPDLRESALLRVWHACREAFEVTVVDTGCCIEHDPHGSLNPLLAARRNAAAITALSQGDVVVSVGRADPLGLSRLANAYPQLLESAADADRLIAMINPLRGVVGWGQVHDAIRGVGLADPVLRLEPAARRHALRARLGRLPRESRYAGRERVTVDALAQRVLALIGERVPRSVASAA